MSGWFGLLGSGEFQPWSRVVDEWILQRVTGDGRVLVLPTASAPEGDEVFTRWAASGLEHFAAAGIPVEVLDVRDRTDAQDAAIAERVVGASVVYVSGGNPAYLARSLAESALWRAVVAGLDRGMGYVGCSAGMACLGPKAPDSAVSGLGPQLWQQGLEYFPHTWFGPHWDVLESFVPGIIEHLTGAVPPGDRLVGVDEQTALVGDGQHWQVLGRGAVHVWEGGGWREHGANHSVTLPLRGSASPR